MRNARGNAGIAELIKKCTIQVAENGIHGKDEASQSYSTCSCGAIRIKQTNADSTVLQLRRTNEL